MAAQNVATFYLDIKVTEGTKTKDEKALYVSKVFSAIESLAGELHPSYIVIHEVRGDAWGIRLNPGISLQTRASPALGPSTSTVSMVSGAPALCATAAFAFMYLLLKNIHGRLVKDTVGLLQRRRLNRPRATGRRYYKLSSNNQGHVF